MHATAIDHVNLGFPENRLDEVVDFYVDTLGFETDFDDPHAAVANDPGLFGIRIGDAIQIYANPTDEFDEETTNFRHVAILVPQSPEEFEAFVDERDLTVDHTADRTHSVHGSYTSFYVSDPFGYTVEFMAYGD